MSLSPGTRIGPYDVGPVIGAGGMGEVYRATDTNLKRQVAIKVLPASVAADADRLARFQREAEVLAALNHPNIAAIHGLEKTPDFTALVMELVEGDDLSERIRSRAESREPGAGLPIDEALPIAKQIAEALEAAHEQGIIHRDLKPANIKVRPDGTVKVLDFGLAKAIEPRAGSREPGADLANSPTITTPAMTQAGMILGTAAYMAPEQARGKVVDKRADIWAFGVVLFEMLSGTRAFGAEDVSLTLANVLKQDVQWAALPADLPAPLRRLLRRCLEKDPRKRLRDIGEARLMLDDPSALEPALVVSPAVVAGAPSRSGRSWPWIVAAAAAAIAIIAVTWSATQTAGSEDDESRSVTTFALTDDSGLRERFTTYPFAVSRDGQTVVFAASNETGGHLWVRTLADPDPHKLPDTENGVNPAISPDGQWVAFVTAGRVIRKVRIDGSGASTVASIDGTTHALAWASDDGIVFERADRGNGMQQVTATGGTPAPLIPLDASANETVQRRPLVLRDHGVILYTSTVPNGPDTIAAFSLKDRRTTRLALEGKQALGVVEGHLIYSREDGFLMAAPFDTSGLRITGPAVQLNDRVLSVSFGTAVTLSESGTLVFAPASLELSRLMLGTAAGARTPLGEWVRAFGNPRFSPDGTRVAATIAAPDGSNDLWVFDLGSTEPTRVTRGEQAMLCGWTPDSKALVYLRSDGLGTAPVGGGSVPSKLIVPRKRFDALDTSRGLSTSPDGQSAFVISRGGKGNTVLSRIPMADGAVETIGEEAGPLTTRGVDPRVSADGKWVAFSDDTDVYVHSLAGGGRVQVSDAGGRRPVWSHDGRRLFYQTPTGTIAATLDLGADVKVASRVPITTIPADDTIVDTSPDGKTLLLQSPVGQGPRVLVAVYWADAVRRELRTRKGQ